MVSEDWVFGERLSDGGEIEIGDVGLLAVGLDLLSLTQDCVESWSGNTADLDDETYDGNFPIWRVSSKYICKT